jgi:hypothetical protein
MSVQDRSIGVAARVRTPPLEFVTTSAPTWPYLFAVPSEDCPTTRRRVNSRRPHGANHEVRRSTSG